jgi:two-component system OmpR family sensor kinase
MSLRARLVVLTVVLAVIGLTVSDALVLSTVRGQLEQRVDQQLLRFGQRFVDGPMPGRLLGGQPHSGSVFLPSQYVLTTFSPDGSYAPLLRSPVTAGDPQPQLPRLSPAQLRQRLARPFTVPADHGGGSWRVLLLAAAGSDPDNAGSASLDGGGLVVATSLDDTDATVSRLSDGFLGIGLAVIAALALAGWLAVWAGLRPLRRIGTTAEEIADRLPLSHRLPEASGRTEIGSLARSLNSMLAQIESAFAARAESEGRMRRFVADASHELRTPLAGIRGFAELYRMGALREEADVKRTMARIESEAVRMGGLVEDLLTLARADEQRPLQLAPMDLRTLAADALHDTTALDPSRPVSLTGPGGASVAGAAFVLGDEARLRQVVTNLVGNAVTHTPTGTAVRIGVGTREDGRAVIEVADEGPGLTAEQAERVFERFYRVDASRSRQDGGGAGLGLAIVAALTQAHGGAVELDTSPGAGCVFRILLPSA